MVDMNKKIQNINGKMSKNKLLHLMKNLFTLWTDKSLFDEKIVTGWQATLKLDK